MKNNILAGFVIVLAIITVVMNKRGEADTSGLAVSTIAGKTATAGSINATGSTSRFGLSGGITTDGTNLFITDTFNNTIRKVVLSTGEVTTLAGMPGAVGSNDGTGSDAFFNTPHGITTDGTNLYVADTNNYSIRKIVISSGVVSTLTGSAGAFGSDDGAAPDARFGAPTGIVTDGTFLYVTDTWNSTIRRVSIATGEVTTLAGKVGTKGSTDGIGATALFNYSTDIATDGTNLYVLDTGSQTIRKIDIATQVVSTLAGRPDVIGSVDGQGAAALFNYPQGIVTDGNNVYVADTCNATIRKIVIATGAVTTLAGLPGKGGSVDGNIIDARFSMPVGITRVDNILYLMDMGAVRKIQ